MKKRQTRPRAREDGGRELVETHLQQDAEDHEHANKVEKIGMHKGTGHRIVDLNGGRHHGVINGKG